LADALWPAVHAWIWTMNGTVLNPYWNGSLLLIILDLFKCYLLDRYAWARHDLWYWSLLPTGFN
jgi:hypothetical protein